jgi:hypothetical protein
MMVIAQDCHIRDGRSESEGRRLHGHLAVDPYIRRGADVDPFLHFVHPQFI